METTVGLNFSIRVRSSVTSGTPKSSAKAKLAIVSRATRTGSKPENPRRVHLITAVFHQSLGAAHNIQNFVQAQRPMAQRLNQYVSELRPPEHRGDPIRILLIYRVSVWREAALDQKVCDEVRVSDDQGRPSFLAARKNSSVRFT